MRPDAPTTHAPHHALQQGPLAAALAQSFARPCQTSLSLGWLVLLGFSTAHAGTLQIQAEPTDPLTPWTVNGEAVTSTSSLNVPDVTTVELALDGAATAATYHALFTNSSSAPGQLTFDLTPGDTAFSAALGISQQQGLVVFDGVGVADTAAGLNGPALQGTIPAGSLPFSLEAAEFNSVTLGPTAAIQYRSRGAAGGDVGPDGADGGAIQVTLAGQLLLGGQVGQGSSSLPWRPAAAGLALRSLGGAGVFQADCDDYTGYCQNITGQGGDSGAVTLQTQPGATFDFSLAPFDSQLAPLATQSAGAPAVALLVHSQGGMGATENFHGTAGPNGKGGTVAALIDQLTLNGSSAYLMGVVAASVGGATAPPAGAKVNVVPSGAGGAVSVQLSQTQITLSGNNSIGVVATSTGDVIVPADSSLSGSGAATFGDVTVQVGSQSQIAVGDPGGPGGTAGNVTLTHLGGTITTRGDGAVGALLQAVAGGGGNGGNAAGLFVAVGGAGGNGGQGGTVTVTQGAGASISTQGDYAQGLVLQSVGGGGGNGGGSTAAALSALTPDDVPTVNIGVAVGGGASLLPNNQRTTENRLAGSPANTGSFNLTREGPKAVGRFNLGVEVQAPKQQNLSFRAEYSAQAGGKFRSQSISARMTYRF